MSRETRFWTILALIVAIVSAWFGYQQLRLAGGNGANTANTANLAAAEPVAATIEMGGGNESAANAAAGNTAQPLLSERTSSSPVVSAATPAAPAIADAPAAVASSFSSAKRRCYQVKMGDERALFCEKFPRAQGYRWTDPAAFGCAFDLKPAAEAFTCAQSGGKRVTLADEYVYLFPRSNRARKCRFTSNFTDAYLRCESFPGSDTYVSTNSREFDCATEDAGTTCRSVGGKRVRVPAMGVAILEAPLKHADQADFYIPKEDIDPA